MKRSLIITQKPIQESDLIETRITNSEGGAVLTFSGIVRKTEGAQNISAIEYEVHEAMAKHQFEKLFDTLESRWTLHSVRLIHRVGRVATRETSLWIEVVSSHRKEAFEACQWLIGEMKKKVPIWKDPELEHSNLEDKVSQ